MFLVILLVALLLVPAAGLRSVQGRIAEWCDDQDRRLTEERRVTFFFPRSFWQEESDWA